MGLPRSRGRRMTVWHLRVSTRGRHTPPTGLAFGEPDDRLQRGIQYAAAFRLESLMSLEYWITRWSLSSGGALRRPGGG
jgi:hypothetical protein